MIYSCFTRRPLYCLNICLSMLKNENNGEGLLDVLIYALKIKNIQ